MTYDVSVVGYLKRAADRLREDSLESLFYAALELRAGVERRSQEYLHPHDHIPRKRKLDYRISRLGKNLDSISLPEDRVVQLTVEVGAIGAGTTVYYTPVNQSLRKKAERLGDYLHAQPFRSEDSEEWVKFEKLLIQTYQELITASTGKLMGAPMLNQSTGRATITLKGKGGLPPDVVNAEGEEIRVEVDYLQAVPRNEVENFMESIGLDWDPRRHAA